MKYIIRKKLSVQPFKNVYHIDTKKRGDFSSADGVVYTQFNAPQAFKDQGHRIVWQPIVDDIKEYDKFFLDILNAGVPAIVNIDECINMNFNGKAPRGLSILIAQGRLPGIDIIGGTQRVAGSPTELSANAMHILVFNTVNRYDLSIAKELLQITTKGPLKLKKYEFYHIMPDVDDFAAKYTSIEQLLPFIR